MSSSSAIPQQLNTTPFVQQSTINLNPFQHFPFAYHQSPSSPQRIKLKRARQRVDAGEPRNSYQANNRTPNINSAMIQQRFPNGFQFVGTNENGGASLGAALFPWMNNQANSEVSTDTEILKDFGVVHDLSQHNATDNDEVQSHLDAGGSCKSLAADDDRESQETEKSNGEVTAKEDDLDELKEDKTSGDRGKNSPSNTLMMSAGNISNSSSSSRRKNAIPQRQQLVEESEDCNNNAVPTETENEDCVNNNDSMVEEVKSSVEVMPQSTLAATLAANNFSHQNKLQEMFEMQRRIYANWVEQQKKLLGVHEEEHRRAQLAHAQQQIQRDFAKLAQALKQEIVNTLTGSIDKVISEFVASETAANVQRLAAIQQQQHQQQQQQQEREREQNTAAAISTITRTPVPFVFPSLYHPFGTQTAASAFPNPFLQAQPMPPSGIFPPTAPQNHAAAAAAAFNPFLSHHLKTASPANNALRKSDDLSPFAPRKKRSKVTDCTRLNKSSSILTRDGSSLPNSARSSPQLSSYFPPTMVGHPLYGGASFTADERESPTNSDDTSDCGAYDGNMNASATLTPMHLRKAKLMFFYTRYPNSALLKSYFPDIRFNKNNTAQLVKWFSNFRVCVCVRIGLNESANFLAEFFCKTDTMQD
ncbi:unnamed protein product [Anisakis simplex]|uniref:Homeobox protein ceh-26 (inferred by orthology to a C. elegans protein) n=1 Tax=Anisakis simplex TaxID=6269 RepID=A0A0M3JXB7_ANISI|nr:unnamed protein product [Anisakis simplex]